MKKVVVGALFAAAVFALGIFTGQKISLFRVATAAAQNAPAQSGDQPPPLQSSSTAPDKSISLADAEAAVASAVHLGSTRQSDVMQNIAGNIRAQDIPQFMRFLEAAPYHDIRQLASDELFARWAKADAPAALSYASAIPGMLLRN